LLRLPHPMALCSDSVDFSNFKKVITCAGRQYDEFSNFYATRLWAEGSYWPTVEHYYQALKFPGSKAADLRETIRNAASPMDSWKLGNDAGKMHLRLDWEEKKVDFMYTANFLKFSQSDSMRLLLTGCKGPILCDGGIFWKTWNEIILERIREELRPDSDSDRDALALRVAFMDKYRSAAASGDGRAVDAVTHWAVTREAPPDREAVPEVTISGLRAPGEVTTFCEDPLKPEVNSCPHWVSEDGWHFFLGVKNERQAWVVDEDLSAREATGFAYREATGNLDVPLGTQVWNVFSEEASRHTNVELTVVFKD